MAASFDSLARDDVGVALRREAEYQRNKWSSDRPRTVAEWRIILRGEFAEAERAWLNHEGTQVAVAELLQFAGAGEAMRSQFGIDASYYCDVAAERGQRGLAGWLTLIEGRMSQATHSLLAEENSREALRVLLIAVAYAVKALDQHGIYKGA